MDSKRFTTKLGTTRAGERTRIWLEGSRLVAAGFECGTFFKRSWDAEARYLKLSLVSQEVFEALPRAERGKVSGKGEKPIIDITGEVVASTFRGSHVSCVYSERGYVHIREA